jgi:hypothetical protein
MAVVLTKDAAIECPHAARAVVVIPPQPARKLTIKGAAALVKADLVGAAIQVCPQSPQTQDLTIASVTGGEAGKLSVRGQGVLLDGDFAGLTDKGAALAIGLAGPGQDKLTAR